MTAKNQQTCELTLGEREPGLDCGPKSEPVRLVVVGGRGAVLCSAAVAVSGDGRHGVGGFHDALRLRPVQPYAHYPVADATPEEIAVPRASASRTGLGGLVSLG